MDKDYNFAGADHLIKIACDAAVGIRDRVTISGTDYHYLKVIKKKN